MQLNAVEVRSLTFQYSGAPEPSLRDINLTLAPGEIALLIGPTGAGKSTLYLALNGLIPNLIRGTMAGSVTIAGMDTGEHGVADIAQKVGIVFQDPETQLFALTVEDELAFGPENLGLPKDEIVRRIREAATIIQLHDLLELGGLQLVQVGLAAEVAAGLFFVELLELRRRHPLLRLVPGGELSRGRIQPLARGFIHQ